MAGDRHQGPDLVDPAPPLHAAPDRLVPGQHRRQARRVEPQRQVRLELGGALGNAFERTVHGKTACLPSAVQVELQWRNVLDPGELEVRHLEIERTGGVADRASNHDPAGHPPAQSGHVQSRFEEGERQSAGPQIEGDLLAAQTGVGAQRGLAQVERQSADPGGLALSFDPRRGAKPQLLVDHPPLEAREVQRQGIALARQAAGRRDVQVAMETADGVQVERRVVERALAGERNEVELERVEP
jgi:hypothetical protein